MFKTIRTSRVTKFIIYYLSIMMFLQITQPMQMYALTSGPTQPEFNAFTPISTSDMVDLTSGDFNYNIPIMDVGGYPLNLAYDSGLTMDQEASWVGLGWNLNVGQITRNVRGLPDDFKGDQMRYENDMRDNITVGSSFNFHPAFFGYDANGFSQDMVNLSLGLGVEYNNYTGISFKPSFGVSFGLSETSTASVGVNFSSSVGEGATVNPSISIGGKKGENEKATTTTSAGFGVGYNSRKGLQNFSVSASRHTSKFKEANKARETTESGSVGGSISLNNSLDFTPTKRVAYDNMNFSFNAALGVEVFGVEGQGQIEGYGSFQRISSAYKNRLVGAYGYDFIQHKSNHEGVLDFNREKEQVISKNTNALPVTNFTYDTYSIDGQGVGGMFRPHRSQVTHLYNDVVTDHSLGISAGAEFGAGGLVHGGINFLVSPSTVRTGNWVSRNNALPLFTEKHTDNNIMQYEPSVFKMVGELNVDGDTNYLSKFHNQEALRIKLLKSRYNNRTAPIFESKLNATSSLYQDHAINGKIKRSDRYLRNQVVQKITDAQAAVDPMITRSSLAKPHHTAGIKILKTDGSTYVFGQPVYSIKKVEATFDVSNKSENPSTNIASGVTSTDGNHSNNSDKYLNRTTTPAYAHSYLLSSILSADYEDVDGNGPTENDLGSYTKFEYANPAPNAIYKWRVPFKSDEVSFNEGLKSRSDDQKGNYLYGEKELKYIKRIITKTHVAIFHLTARQDARGASNELGTDGQNGANMYQLNKISLYSLTEAKAAKLLNDNPDDDLDCVPIKEAHFEYGYNLCPNTPSNLSSGTKGKLTLERLYFTYKNSKMGKYTPYVFKYSDFNPSYHIKGFDVWGNYKPVNPAINSSVTSALTNAEFPFVQQVREAPISSAAIDNDDPKYKADLYTSAWVLKSVKLPSGGELTINTESDDYRSVQNKKAMQMFKVVGTGDDPNMSDLNNVYLYNGNAHRKYIYVDLGFLNEDLTVESFKSKYLSENLNAPIYFNFLLNMTNNSSQYEYVRGYVKIDGLIGIKNDGDHKYAAIPLEYATREGGTNGGASVNPIAKAGWGFGRMYLNKVVYSIGGNSSNTNFVSIVQDLVGSIATVSELWKGPNKALQDKGCAQQFIPNKSWIRLENPDGFKLGGGLRVKSIELSDNWDVMTSSANPIYKQLYGQTYDYTTKKLGKVCSSGVATFEPNASPENPFVKPFYPDDGNYADRISAPKDQNYIEEPFGEGFFPSPKVTYSSVTVSNLKRGVDANETGPKVTKHATGKVITTHYTSYDFPTKVDYTDLSMTIDKPNPVTSFLNIRSVNHLAASQGFSIETNDMDGKVRKQEVFAEGNNDNPISSVEYKYNLDDNGNLSNNVTTIDERGEIKNNSVGVEYDLINDFNESKSNLTTMGFDGNLAVMIYGIFPAFVPMVLPKYSYHESLLNTAVTTKVIHRTGILKETIATDVGSTVNTQNLAWDANSGEVLLTKTINEYDDTYYSFNYPAYWVYDGMGLASNNIGIEGTLQLPNQCAVDARPHFLVNGLGTTPIQDLFHVGDELILQSGNSSPFKAWVVGFGNTGPNNDQTGLLLMNKDGVYTDECGIKRELYNFRLVRSGYRNLQQANMASITLMNNPLEDVDIEITEGITHTYIKHEYNFDENSTSNPRIINTSAVVYHDFWRPQNEGMQINPTQGGNPVLQLYPNLANDSNPDSENELLPHSNIGFNPYLWNVKGDWRAKESFAYLTGRVNITESLRNKGFYKRFRSFYHRGGNHRWKINTDISGWTSASKITKYSPFGAEIENEDALHRFSSAQYGYNYTLPMAVASNSRYNQIGFEGFEETPNLNIKKHFDFRDSNQSLVLSANHSHTGKKSVKVTPNNPVKLVRRLSPVVNEASPIPCSNPGCDNLLTINFIPNNDFPNGPVFPCSTLGGSILIGYFEEYTITNNCSLPINLITDENSGLYTITGNGTTSVTIRIDTDFTPDPNTFAVESFTIDFTVGAFTTQLFYTRPQIRPWDTNSNGAQMCLSPDPDAPPEECCTYDRGTLECSDNND